MITFCVQESQTPAWDTQGSPAHPEGRTDPSSHGLCWEITSKLNALVAFADFDGVRGARGQAQDQADLKSEPSRAHLVLDQLMEMRDPYSAKASFTFATFPGVFGRAQ